MRLSIIIPVYQVKHGLARCLDSVLQQSFRDFQVILVDDASTDGSAQLCEDYKQKDRRVQVVTHKQNLGLSEARNSGLKKAKGDYVTFIDSDDAIEKGTLAALMEILTIHPDYDLLEYPIYERYGNIVRQHILRFPRKEYTNMDQYWLEGQAYKHSYVTNKIFRRDLFRGLTFPAHRLFEDVFVLPQVLQRCKVVATTDVGLYYYYFNPKSITETADGIALRDLLQAHLRMLPQVHNANYYADVVNIAIDVYNGTGEMPHLPTLPYQHTAKLKIKKYLGMKGLCRIVKMLHPFKYRS